MLHKWLAVWIVIFGLAILLMPQTDLAQAQEPTPENDANCVTCHEHQYYLYDSGKWFCLCDAPMHCVYCHGGRTDSPLKDVAHEGLVLYPTRGHAERCQTCHQEDYMSRVVTFTKVAGVSATPIPLITATPAALAAVPVEQPPESGWLITRHFDTWQLVGLSAIGIVMIGIVIFGYRCWKADCMRKASRT